MSHTKPNHHPIKAILAHRKHSTTKWCTNNHHIFPLPTSQAGTGMLWSSHIRKAYDVMERSTHENECWETSTAQRARIQIQYHCPYQKCGTNTEDSKKDDRDRRFITHKWWNLRVISTDICFKSLTVASVKNFFFSLLPFPDSESLHSVLVYALTLVLRSLTFPRIYLLSLHPDNLIFSEYGISHHGKTCWACSIDK